MYRFLFVLACMIISIQLISCGESTTATDDTVTMYDISVSITPEGSGTVSAAGSYEAGDTVELQAESNEGYQFTNWTGDIESSDNPLSLTVNQDYNLTANYEAKTYSLTINSDGEGSVSKQVVEKASDYGYGTQIELTAKPDEGWEFFKWEGDLDSYDNPATITMDNEKEVKALFKTAVYQQGTIFLYPDIITNSDPSAYQNLSYTGREEAEMYDRRTQSWVTVNAYIFEAFFKERMIEVQVNPEFENQTDAMAVAEKYLPAIGRIPTVLRKDVDEIWIHKGNQPFGGGNNSLLIHDEFGDTYISQDILEETFMHEAVHTSLDADHATSAGWKEAQGKDPAFVSQYAVDYPNREDLAESFVSYVAVEYRSDRISQQHIDSVRNGIPNRIQYFNAQSFDMYPFVK